MHQLKRKVNMGKKTLLSLVLLALTSTTLSFANSLPDSGLDAQPYTNLEFSMYENILQDGKPITRQSKFYQSTQNGVVSQFKSLQSLNSTERVNMVITKDGQSSFLGKYNEGIEFNFTVDDSIFWIRGNYYYPNLFVSDSVLPSSWTQTIEGFESKFALENKLTNCIDFSPNNKNEKANVKLDIVGTATSEDVSNHVQLQSMKLCITRV